MHHAWIGLAGGLAAFAHCLGMCGGFALHLSRGARAWPTLGRQLVWHAGKTATYVFLGALAGFGGGLLVLPAGVPWVQRALAYAAGAVMILAGLRLLGCLPGVRAAPGAPPRDGLWPALFRNFFQEPDARGALGLGLATGFLPCPVVAAFLAYSLQTGSVAAGMLTMAGVGAGTAAPLLLAGLTGHAAAGRSRHWGAVAGLLLLLLGAVTALRGTDALHRWLGCPGQAAAAPCCVHEK